MTPPSPRAVLIAVLAVAVSAVVALAASGSGLIHADAPPAGAWAWGVRLAAVAAVGVAVAVLLRQRRGMPRGRTHGPDPTAEAFGTAATIMAVLVLVALAAPRTVRPPDPMSPPPQSAGESTASEDGGPARVVPPPPATGAFPRRGRGDETGRSGVRGDPAELAGVESASGAFLRRFAWVLLAVLILVVVGMAYLARKMGAGFKAGDRFAGMRVDAAEAAAGLEASLEEMTYPGRDPGRQITAAYRRLLAELAAAGAPRQPEEAPFEFLHRVLGPLGVPAGPMQRLTRLHVVAQFSRRPVTEDHRQAAGEALQEALASLRTAQVQ